MDTISHNAATAVAADSVVANDKISRWSVEQVEALFNLPFND
jgi:hypothetical protein